MNILLKGNIAVIIWDKINISRKPDRFSVKKFFKLLIILLQNFIL